MVVTLCISVVRFITVWFLRPGPEKLSVNWKGAPGVVIVKFGLLFKSKSVHVEVTPFNVLLFPVVDGGEIESPSCCIFVPVMTY